MVQLRLGRFTMSVVARTGLCTVFRSDLSSQTKSNVNDLHFGQH